MLFTKKSEPTALYKGVALNYMDILPVSALTKTNFSFLVGVALFFLRPRRSNVKELNISIFLTCWCAYGLQFGLFANPPKQMLEEVGLKDMKLPMLLVFFSTNGTAESVQGMPYQGGFNYEEMTATFDQVRFKHIAQAPIPGRNSTVFVHDSPTCFS